MASLRFQGQTKPTEQQYIDEDEQKKIIAEYEKQDEQLSRKARLGVGLLVAVLSIVNLLCAVLEWISPNYVPFHSIFRDLYPIWTISFVHVLSSSGHVLCYIGAFYCNHLYVNIGVLTSILVPFYWMYGLYLWNKLMSEEIWLAVVNPMTLLLCWYMRYLSSSLKPDIAKLKNFTYKYKAV
ncbi:uncharacterized protein [Dysidea avara]|uniref:uncharacterized protein n=1 Tax=Dysidea avara TaxID=196820 RepID=UPI0033234767